MAQAKTSSKVLETKSEFHFTKFYESFEEFLCLCAVLRMQPWALYKLGKLSTSLVCVLLNNTNFPLRSSGFNSIPWRYNYGHSIGLQLLMDHSQPILKATRF